ncbi:MAG: UbiA family prenyltransferase [Chloroflexi bacterium]|nr:UbiA family prenyltransferase [Chloroflexota bacterium]MCC6892472.1 UbiA family prenyltransferase [Anaerolineae bacterium]
MEVWFCIMLKQVSNLIFNHADAWGITLIIGIVALIGHESFKVELLGVPVVMAFCYWLGFAVNDYFDAPFDAQEAKKGARNFFVGVKLSRLNAGILFAGISVALGVFFAQFGVKGLLVVACGLLAIWAYSAPPLRLKSRPIADLLMHMFFVQTFPYLATMLLVGLEWSRLDTALVSIFVLTSLSAQLEQQIRDYAVDVLTDHNFTVTFGRQVSSRLMLAASGTLIVLFAYYILAGILPLFILPFGLIFLPMLLHRFFRDTLAARSELLGRVMLIAALIYAGYVSTSGLLNLWK